ncbi:tetratricopeptide repeat-containing hybrid sensor histidine kinase/response regulator [Ascidiimonas aurantiaca]|uniref:tetratricopeptide repeat-containing hybrid sensor histidine kinase/response regulator n=1 Tax=Ascidiimonas aurantiaca TaxID=1685432 RepID=UPI0030EDDE60
MKLARIHTWFAILISFVSYSQEVSPLQDSIKNILNKSYEAQEAYNVKESIEYANQAIELSKKIDNTYFQYHAYNAIGINFEMISDYKRAEKNYQKALDLALELKNDTLLGWSYNNLGNVYSDGYKDKKLGIEFYNKALEYAVKFKDDFEVSIPNLNIGWTYIDNNEYEKALPYLSEVKKYAFSEQNTDELSKIQVNYLLGRYYKGIGDVQQAESYFEKAAVLGENESAYLELADIYKHQSELYEKTGKTYKAFEALKAYNFNKGKVIDKELVKQLEIAKAMFDVDEYRRDLASAEAEKKVQAAIAKRSNIITLVAVIVAVVLMVLLTALFKNYKEKNTLSSILRAQNEALEKSKEEAEKLSQIKSQFISTVSHELRTPLYGVVGLTTLLMEESTLSDKENEYLRSLKFSGDYLLNLINDVLQLSKIESNKLKLEETRFNIETLANSIIKSFEFQLEQANTTIHLEIDETIPYILKGDTVRLSQVLINLIGNSIKFTRNGDIWLRIRHNHTTDKNVNLHFEIEDTGIGIPKTQQQEIFENFSQLDRDNGDFQGTGLGLSIVKKLINLFGGEIHLESETGKGAKFSFDINFKQAKIGKGVEKDDVEVENIHVNNRILIVEDNKINQIVTQNILKKESFETFVVDNGFSAIEAIRSQKFDLVLMDLNMPKMNGFEATKKIREFDKKTPIIALTAASIEEVKAKLQKSGMDDIINKPYDTQEFYQVILRNINKS